MNARRMYLSIRFFVGLVLTLSLALGRATPASAAQRCYVKAGAAGNGTSWANAYGNPQEALANAACTEIWVAKGTYKPTNGTDRTISFALKSGVAMYGGFAGNEGSLSEQDWKANVTILSGEIGPAGQSDNSFHVVDGTGTDGTARLDGFTITAGNANNEVTWPHDVGGGMLNNPGSPALANLIFSQNSGLGGGGMANLQDSAPTLLNVTFSNNSAASLRGGAIYNDNSKPSLTDVVFNANSASLEGGAVFNFQSSPSLANVTFSGNSGGYGGGMYNSVSSSPVLTSVTFSANSASNHGGALVNDSSSSPILRNVTFSGNSAALDGGGIYNTNGSTPRLTNVTMSGNTAPSGGGIFNANDSHPVIRNSILYGDTVGEITNADTSSTSVTFSIVQGTLWPGTGNRNANPRLKPLGNYGGFTRTRPLGLGSPAIDHGTNSGCPLTDQRGVPRPQDGDLNGTTTCDMGATESRLVLKPFPSTGSQDGWVLESTETSGVGGTPNSTDPTLLVGDSINRQQARGILSFNTAALPDTAQLVSVVLRLKLVNLSTSTNNPFSELGSLLVDLRKGPFSNNPALQAADFQATPSKPAAMTILNNPVGGWYSRAVPATSFKYINKAGLTQSRLRFSLDDNNDEISNYIRFNSGNATTASDRPVLVIKYYLP